MMNMKDPNTKKAFRRVMTKSFGRKVLHSFDNPNTTILVSLNDLQGFAERIGKIITNTRNKEDINYNWFDKETIVNIKANDELCINVWNKACEEKDYKWRRLHKEASEKANSEIIKTCKKMELKINQQDKVIEKAVMQVVSKFMMSVYLDRLDNGIRFENLYKAFVKRGQLKKSQNLYNRGGVDTEEFNILTPDEPKNSDA